MQRAYTPLPAHERRHDTGHVPDGHHAVAARAELERIAEHARERIARLQGPDRSSELTRAVFYRELAAWPEWAEWAPEPPIHMAALERRWWE